VSIRVLHRVARRHSPAHPHRQLLGDPVRRFADPPEENAVDIVAPRSAPTSRPLAGGGSFTHRANVTYGHDAILHLPTAYQEVTVDPDADRMLIVTLAVPYFNWVVDYSHIAANAIFYLALDNGVTLTTSLFQATESGVGSLLANGESATAVFANDSALDATPVMIARNIIPDTVFGKAITLGMFNGSNGNLQGGDPANTLDLSVLFHVYDRAQRKLLTVDESGWDGSAFAA